MKAFFGLAQGLGRICILLIFLGVLILGIFSFQHPQRSKILIYKAYREYARFSMGWETRCWRELKGENFNLSYQAQDENVARLVLDTAEKIYAPVNQSLGFTPKGKIPIVLYPDTASLNHCFGWAANERAMGVYYAGVIRILSPNSWIFEKDQEEQFLQEGPIPHEYAHLIVDYIAGGNYPRWLTEGVAQRVERDISGYEMPLTGEREIYPLAQMDQSFDLLPNQSAAYRQSLAMVDFLVDGYSLASLEEILKALGRGKSLNQVFTQNLGLTLQEFEEEFRQNCFFNQTKALSS